MTDSEAYFIYNLLPNIGAVRVRKLTEHFGSVSGALSADGWALRGIPGIKDESVNTIINWRTIARPEEEMARVEALGMRIVARCDPDFPPMLREIYDPPHVLYTHGTVPTRWPRGIAVVGSRKTSTYGLDIAKKLSFQLAYAGVPIVSGLARGIDTVAHQAAIAAKGITWAVQGRGLDAVYPPENEALGARIAESGGCVFSEFPLGYPPDRKTFPRRNRIVSGMSYGVLVIEAGVDSGALITARQALEQGRHVMAVPGRVDNPQARGCHLLIKEGATLVEDVDDVLKSMEFLSPTLREETAELPLSRAAPENLSDTENAIFSALGTDETPIDELTLKTGLSSREVSSTLFRLEMKKLVKQLPGKVFVRTA
ncbi:MAG: DNA-processing protein DprA [Candidatus Methylacidiphilales bacterium]|nr:DNA-processing protein DprA [Candidatus Methylacidiphilales bacterium]